MRILVIAVVASLFSRWIVEIMGLGPGGAHAVGFLGGGLAILVVGILSWDREDTRAGRN